MQRLIIRTALAMILLIPSLAASEVARPTLSDLVRRSDQVVRGRFVAAEALKQNLPIGDEDSTAVVFTYLTFDPAERIISDGSQGPLVVRLWGGFWEGKAIVDVDAPRITDREVVLFLKRHQRPGRRRDEVVYEVPYAKYGQLDVRSTGNGDVVRSDLQTLDALGVTSADRIDEHTVELQRFRDLVRQGVETKNRKESSND